MRISLNNSNPNSIIHLYQFILRYITCLYSISALGFPLFKIISRNFSLHFEISLHNDTYANKLTVYNPS